MLSEMNDYLPICGTIDRSQLRLRSEIDELLWKRVRRNASFEAEGAVRR